MTSDKKKIPINNHHGAPQEARGDDGGRWDDGVAGTFAAAAPHGAAAPHAAPAPADSPASSADLSGETVESGLGDIGDGGDAFVEPTPLELVTGERDAYLDALRRLQAEFDNYRRRSQRESTEVRARARSGLLGEFLPVFDNLTRALDAAEHHEEGKVLDGVRLTHNLFADLLRREGVEEIHPLGSAFDPNLHEAIASLPSAEQEGTVISVVEKGYTAGDTVLRPARVAVSAGPPAGSAEE